MGTSFQAAGLAAVFKYRNAGYWLAVENCPQWLNCRGLAASAGLKDISLTRFWFKMSL
jgi:hypothetical protein